MEIIEKVISSNGLVFAFLFVGFIMLFSFLVSKKLLRNKIPGVAIAILIGLALAFLGDKNGMADIPIFAGMAILGGSMFRDFAVVATAMSADISKIKRAGLAGIISLFIGVTITFFLGALIAYFMGYTDAVSMTTIGAGACTYIVGPVTGGALGASSDVIAISVATGVIKTIFTTIITPVIAKSIKLNNPHAAVVFGGLIGTTSGVVAGLAATDEKLVPYGALTATFYTGVGCLLCPSVFYLFLKFFGF
ncbi:malonate transporter subunit MadM [Maribacter hydrothermalis]|uniref:Malonate transporter subunit MadM n=1 Tax=Maribacter hydrothermalis TaxID=1836467 RepID=A0A1B7YXP0_9FLAO|nr:malonate transporter subunit MadM [Maribacter hydrothermalis]APQ16799.1 malonate transporter subunit MadM [Maribacter hydrothermalis]OBR35228.1 malonate transporter subunit MadM [Maribacter hydrothermalis]